jgi:predicted RNase H-like HicB family nuclease
MESENKEIHIEYDTVSNNYYVVWQPMVVVSAGSTRKEALDDLKKAAHFGIDTILNREVEQTG